MFAKMLEGKLNKDALPDLYSACISAQTLYELALADGWGAQLPGLRQAYRDLKEALQKAKIAQLNEREQS